MLFHGRTLWWLFLLVALLLGACSAEAPAPMEEETGALPESVPEAIGESHQPPVPEPEPEPEYAPAAAAPPPARIDAEELWESFSKRSEEGSTLGAGDSPVWSTPEEPFEASDEAAFEPSMGEEDNFPAAWEEKVSGEGGFLPHMPASLPDATTPAVPLPKPSVDEAPFVDEGTHHRVQVFFATDRNQTGADDSGEKFGSGRGSLTYGSCEVSIPRQHRTGELEAPRWWRLEFSENPAKHVVLLRTDIASADEFFTRVSERVRQSPEKNAFVFVHGYNVTFENAARRTAQITFDLGFRGAPVFYSWPSQGETGKYTVDEQNIEWTEAHLKRFLADFFERSQAESIYLVAHSMGNRGLTRALKTLVSEKPGIRQRLQEVILTAPDIDAEVFKRDIAPALTAFQRPVTLYASSEDVALKASKKVHGYPRAGDSGDQIVIVPGIETVDATGIDTSFFRHSYFAEAELVLTDIFDLMRHRLRADERGRLEAVDTPDGRYWTFKD